ncbi:MAG: BON domain-containing protein [Gammaproteobacteria bacterium]|nr:BON domain-containing protein [Gammaproteobacteria bacterium]
MTHGSITPWAATLIAVSALTGACASNPDPPAPPAPSSAESLRSDLGATNEVLAHTLYAELNADPMYYFRHVDVHVDKGVARLSGYVWSTDAIYQARKIALRVPGITAVSTSELQLERNGRDSGVAR